MFNGLVLENTTRCNARCGMCYQSSGPQGSPHFGRAKIREEEAVRVIDEASKIPRIAPRFHLSGGEAFLQKHEALRLFAAAKASGFLDITCTTNAYWAASPRRAEQIAQEMFRSGVTGVEVSWDYWHQPFIRAKAIDQCLIACASVGIETNLRLLTTKSHTAEEALSVLDPAALVTASRITSGPVFPTGSASVNIPESDFFAKGDLTETCHTYLNLTVNAAGKVAPCCAGLDQAPDFSFGDVRVESLIEIERNMQRSPLLRLLVFRGVSVFSRILRESGVELDEDKFAGICHMCWSIFSDGENVNNIESYFVRRSQAVAMEVLARKAEEQAPVLCE